MNYLRFYIYYIFLHLTLTASSFIQIGDAISVNLDSSATYVDSSNIIKAATNEKSDGIYTITPGAVVNFSKPGAVLGLKVKAYYDIIQYRKYDNLDTELSRVSINGSYNPSAIFENSFSYSNNEGQSARSELSIPGQPNLVETTTKSASFSTNYKYSPKLSFSLGVTASDLSYDTLTDELASKKTTTVPFNLIYHYSDKLNILYGVSVTERKIGKKIAQGLAKYDTDSIYYNVGLSGNILPKLTGKFDVGYRTLSFSTATKDFNGYGATSALTWRLTPKFSTSFNASRDFDSAGSGDTYRTTNGRISANYQINTEYSLDLSYGRTEKFFRGNPARGTQSRDESLTNASLNLRCTPSANYGFSVGYHYSKSDALSDYDLKEYRISANLKY